MKMIARILCFMPLACAGVALAQSPSPSAAGSPMARTEVYHVHFNHAAPGKAVALGDFLKTPGPNAPMPGHMMVLRHEDGAPWDYCGLQHLGPKATVDAAGNARGPSMKELSDWHDDTFVNGPSWEEVSRALGLADKDKSASAVYSVSVYRSIPGHEDALEKFLSQPPAAGDKSAGQVLFQHLEGGAWRYLVIVRYNSWQDFAATEVDSVAQSAKNKGPWFELRDHVSFHNDTLAYRIAP
jgi:hypothetical protein